MIDALTIGEFYSNETIFTALRVGNAGGIRLSLLEKSVSRVAIMVSVQDSRITSENPYHDRLENDILTYTEAGKTGEQTLAGVNLRLIEQKQFNFPIHGFVSIASRRDKAVGPKRWKYLGLLEFQRHYPDTQLDSQGKIRRVWIFEFKIHQEQQVVPLAFDTRISAEILAGSRSHAANTKDDDEIATEADPEQTRNLEKLEHVNARAGLRLWVFENALVQVQAKRWLHSVGRKEVAELRGSLQPFAKGAVVTTSHFTRAAINEASGEGKNPITLIDGFRLSNVILDEQFPLSS
jgi:hypothetical protein